MPHAPRSAQSLIAAAWAAMSVSLWISTLVRPEFSGVLRRVQIE